jgi:hypothetical protein
MVCLEDQVVAVQELVLVVQVGQVTHLQQPLVKEMPAGVAQEALRTHQGAGVVLVLLVVADQEIIAGQVVPERIQV